MMMMKKEIILGKILQQELKRKLNKQNRFYLMLDSRISKDGRSRYLQSNWLN